MPPARAGALVSKMFDAAERGDIPKLKECLAAGVSVDIADQRKSPGGVPTALTPLHWACRNGQTSAVAHLLEAGASIAVRDGFGREALRHAAACGNSDAVRLVLSSKADVNARDVHGWSAVARAAHRGHSACVRLLLEAGAPASIAVAKVARKGGHESVALLIERWGGLAAATANPSSAAGSGHQSSTGSSPTSSPAAHALGALLGRGIFSEVHASATRPGVAVKTCKPFDANGATKADLSRGKMVLRELRVLRLAPPHPNLVVLTGAVMSESSTGSKAAARAKAHPVLTLQLLYACASTDLQRLVNSSMRRHECFATPSARRAAAADILAGVTHLHSLGVAHRDVKPANILVVDCPRSQHPSVSESAPSHANGGAAAQREARLRLVVCDLGCARAVGSMAPRNAGTLWYRPPEVVLALPPTATPAAATPEPTAAATTEPMSAACGTSKSRYTSGQPARPANCRVTAAHDLWAVGCTLTEMLTGAPLLAANDEVHWAELYRALNASAHGRVPKGAARDEAALIATLLADEPSARLGVRALHDPSDLISSPDASAAAGGGGPAGPSSGSVAAAEQQRIVALEDIDAASSADEVRRILCAEVTAWGGVGGEASEVE